MASSQATEPLAELDFDAELAALEQEQDVSATQEVHEVPENAVSDVLADGKEASEEEEAPPSSQARETLAPPAPASEQEKEVKDAEPASEIEASKETSLETSETAAPSKPAAKKPLVGRKPLVAAKKAEPVPAAEPPAPKKGKLLVKKARVVEEEEVEEEGDDPAAKPSKPSLVKKAAPLLPKTKAPAAKKAPAAAAAAGPEGPLVKPAKNAYFIYSEENRARIKEENPGASMGEISKLLGAAYKALSQEEMAVYVAKAAEDKKRVEREIADGGVLPARKTKAGGAAAAAAAGKGGSTEKKKPVVKRQKNAPYDLFCEEQRPILKKENPKAGAPELSKLLSDAWKQLDAEGKAPFMQRSKELKAAAKAAAAAAADDEDNDGEEDEAGPSSAAAASGGSKKRTKAPARKAAAAGSKRAKVQAADGDDDEVMPDAGAEDDEDDEDDVDRENVDWEAHPASAILSKTKTMYIVARRGLPLHEYGEVSIEAANLQLRAGQAPPNNSDGTAAKPCPLTLELLHDYDTFCKDFRRDVFDSSEGNELVLEHLRDGSLLEACSFLGSMKEVGHELATLTKDDIWIKVPMMATSRLIQRVINISRRENEDMKARVVELEAELAAALASKNGSGAAEAAAVSKGAVAAQKATMMEI